MYGMYVQHGTYLGILGGGRRGVYTRVVGRRVLLWAEASLFS